MTGGELFTHIDKIVELPATTVGNRTLRPIARVQGWYARGGEEGNGGSGAVLRVAPKEVIVEEGGDQYSVTIVDPLREPLHGFVMAGIAVGALSLIVMIVTRRIVERKS